jgi:hypothetical protein
MIIFHEVVVHQIYGQLHPQAVNVSKALHTVMNWLPGKPPIALQ